MFKHALFGLCLTATPLMAQDVNLTCSLTIICVEVSTCSDWGAEIAIGQSGDVWHVNWGDDLPSDYSLAADIEAPEGSLEPTRLRSLIHMDEVNQSVQFISFDGLGNLVVTLHQPHIRPRSVTGYGLCTDATE